MEQKAPLTKRQKIGVIVSASILALVVVAVIVGSIVRAGQATPATSTPSPSSSASATLPSASASPGATAAPGSSESPAPNSESPIAPEMAPVAPTDEAEGPDGVVIQLEKIESVDGVAAAPGEIAGPSVRLSVTIRNDSAAPVNLGFAVVNAYIGADRVPAGTLMSPGGKPFGGTILPGESATGVYIFLIPEDQRGDVTVAVDYAPGQPTAVFRGALN